MVADVMLGKLARWLRILGYDTAYEPKADDLELIRRATDEGRLLLTRDRCLARVVRPGFRAMLIHADLYPSQLKEVLAQVEKPSPGILTRCILCNVILEETPHHAVAGEVPEYVLMTHRRFSRCPSCRRIYWQGSHTEEIRKTLLDLGIVRSTCSLLRESWRNDTLCLC